MNPPNYMLLLKKEVDEGRMRREVAAIIALLLCGKNQVNTVFRTFGYPAVSTRWNIGET